MCHKYAILFLALNILRCSAFTRNILTLTHLGTDPLPKDMWFEQKLDHFDPSNAQTWQQRYRVNNTLFKNLTHAPVFLMIGGEGPADAILIVKGALMDYAQRYGALCFQLEHRFYGKSHPTPDMSTQNLKYLSSEQALADLANFIQTMNKNYNLTKSNKWVAFGGSYSGSLAAWLRYKYPHFVHAAISSSAPLLAKADFKEYNKVVQMSLETHNSDCAESVHQAAKHLDQLVQHQSGRKIVGDKFKSCELFDTDNSDDVSTLISSLSDVVNNVVQYNKDNGVNTRTIDDICKIMVDRSKGDPIDRYAAVYLQKLNDSNSECSDFKYAESIAIMKNIQWEYNVEPAVRAWYYQTCTEFGFYQTSSTSGELFGKNLPLKFFTKQCQDVFGPELSEKILDEGIKRTNMIYGELHLTVNRVLFVHGSIDPWHSLGVTSNTTYGAAAIFINGTAHCADMYPASSNDSPQLVKARTTISDHIGAWLDIE